VPDERLDFLSQLKSRLDSPLTFAAENGEINSAASRHREEKNSQASVIDIDRDRAIGGSTGIKHGPSR